jgi:hypothetical protein
MAELLDDGRAEASPMDSGEPPRPRRRRSRTYVLAGVATGLLTATAVVLLPDRDRAGTADQAAYEPFLPDSAAHAMTWVRALAEGNDLHAWILLCDAGLDRYPRSTGGQLQADFKGFVGGHLSSATVADAVVVDGSYYVTMTGTVDTGAVVEFMVHVVSEDSRRAACGFGDPSQIP